MVSTTSKHGALDVESQNHDEERANLISNSQQASNKPSPKVPLSLGPLSSCLLYSGCSMSMVLANKSLASSHNTNFNILLVVFQAVVAVLLCSGAKAAGKIDYPEFQKPIAMQWLPVNLIFCGMLYTSMQALTHNNVPMVTVFKNIANIFIAAGDYVFFNKPSDGLTKLAFGVMLTGAIAASYKDMHITFVGIFWMFANCLFTAGYVLYMKFATQTVKLSKFGMVYYNNVLATAILLPVTLFNGEMSEFLSRVDLHTFPYFVENFFAGFVGFFLNFASLSCVAATGPTTYAIVGTVNKIPTSIIGSFVFDAEISPETWFFIAVSMTGGFIYSWAKIKQQQGK
ncbi:hypothetical protein TrLO_g8246 [Triparma laevis f. longispina]|uniref:Sugar phosphate transporter domain-containing protein n=3 Tax=Triparma laevis TaxID=1534972 RepID=A0A9W7CMT7_9STRA|nr:hypothetical protein TrLO_g8246 [Triparma laevis f. longispina]